MTALGNLRATREAEERSKPPGASDWSRAFGARLAITDFVVIAWAVIGTQIAWFGTLDAELNMSKYRGGFGLNYTLVSATLIVTWAVILTGFGSRDSRFLGSGTNEYRRVVDATVRLFGVVAIIAFLFQLDLARGYIILSFPIGLFALLASRWMWRQWLSAQRLRGRFSSRVLLVGSRVSVAAIARDLARAPGSGYLVVGACIPGDTIGEYLDGAVPVSTNLDELQSAMDATGADTLVVTSSEELPPERIRELSWSLEPGRQHLVLAPSLTDVGGPRIHMRPVAGLPLIHVETPRYEGMKRFSKRAFDVVSSVTLIVVLSPVLLAVAVAVGFSTSGPVLFRQERVGLNGNHFKMLKFRTMVIDAESRLGALSSLARTEGNSVMFKMKDDPRVTPVGGFLRRFSMDELPQLFNVLLGTMSLVGPRPPLDSEVAIYENHVHRRFLVKPGITGLWQVSGRSNL
jgi:exopolysaccharide biosynthesis polyprenyl glycosylphosphotransferase